jgi:cell division protein FtsZ
MIHFDLPKEKSSIIKVIGVGGGGGNAVNYMFNEVIDGVNFIICNTDAQALRSSHVPNKVQLGPNLTQGLGAGANPEIGRQATEESLEEIKRILEVNTKMAFITAGMGGGTGTGGAPIIAKICRDLNILTVGIVTTPFTYEGKKRQLQAEEGIKTLKQYVDTLLVISNDKLRHQYGNLKMREAFAKADNVLATAAKCITDVISSTGQINVDFADVCTVMRNGGVAILGSGTAAGESRAQKAIEQALNSPLLNDSDITGAKWILININSAEGEHEFSMDEVEVIQNYLLSQAGENTDVILGLGYDSNLDDQLGITLIATGFSHKDPFTKAEPKKTEKKEDKIFMILGQTEEKSEPKKEIVQEEKPKEETVSMLKQNTGGRPDLLSPKLVEEFPIVETPMPTMHDISEKIVEERSTIIHWELKPAEEAPVISMPARTTGSDGEKLLKKETEQQVKHEKQTTPLVVSKEEKKETNPAKSSAVSGGYLARPANIYADVKKETPPTTEKKAAPPVIINEEEDLIDMQMQLIEKQEMPETEWPMPIQEITMPPADINYDVSAEEMEEQQRKAAERLQKLRNLSFNVNSADQNNEFETVPAYIRRNMELHTKGSAPENFYSSYEVKTDENNKSTISTINTFLDGKKPD